VSFYDAVGFAYEPPKRAPPAGGSSARKDALWAKLLSKEAAPTPAPGAAAPADGGGVCECNLHSPKEKMKGKAWEGVGYFRLRHAVLFCKSIPKVALCHLQVRNSGNVCRGAVWCSCWVQRLLAENNVRI